jgi:hypothetical protein
MTTFLPKNRCKNLPVIAQARLIHAWRIEIALQQHYQQERSDKALYHACVEPAIV